MPKRIPELRLRDKPVEGREQTIDIWGNIGSERIFFFSRYFSLFWGRSRGWVHGLSLKHYLFNVSPFVYEWKHRYFDVSLSKFANRTSL